MPDDRRGESRDAVPVALPDHLLTVHRRFVATETMIGSFMSGFVPAVIIWLTRTPVPLPVLGSNGLATPMILGTLGPAFSIAIGLTLVVRRRVRTGGAPALGWPLRPAGPARFLPGSVILRGLVMALLATIVLVPFGLSLMMACGVERLTGTQFILYNFVHGIAMGIMVFPVILIRALADGAAGDVRAQSATARA